MHYRLRSKYLSLLFASKHSEETRKPDNFPFSRVLGIVSAAMVVALAGCGGGSSDSNSATQPLAPPTTYTVGGSISGLSSSGLVLANGNATTSPAAAASTFTFPTAVASGASYSVTVQTQPSGETCTVSDGSGTIASSDVTDIQVSCALTVSTTSTATAIDPALPSSVSKSISQVISSADAEAVGPALAIPTISTGPNTPIFAVDAKQNLILAAYATSSTTTLSSDSTAVALVMIALGPLPPSGLSFAQAVQDIKATAEYPTLVAAINSALTAGTPPLQSATVLQGIVMVLNQSSATLISQVPTGTTSTLARQAEAVGPTTIPANQLTTALPSPIVGTPVCSGTLNSGCWLSVYANGVNGANGSVTVIDSMPIEWTANSFDQNGITLYTSASAQAGVILSPCSSLLAILTICSPTSMPGDREEFAITLSQTPTTQQDNAHQLIASFVSGGISVSLGLYGKFFPTTTLQGCALKIANNFMGNGPGSVLVTELLAAPSGTQAEEIFATNFSASTFSSLLTQGLTGCGITVEAAATANLASYLVPILGEIDGISSLVGNTNIALGLAEQATETWHYWNGSASVGVCENTSGSAVTLANCAVSFNIAAPPNLPIGASAALQVQALDVQGNPTLYDTYNTFQWTPSVSGIASTSFSTGGWVVQGLSPGTTTLEATDPYTLISGTATVTVGEAPSIVGLSVSNVSPEVGTPVTFTVSVAPSPENATYPAPTGTVSIVESGTTLCTTTLSESGTGACNYAFSNAGSQVVSANYAGDSSYAPETSSSTTVTPGGVETLTINLSVTWPMVSMGSGGANGTITLAVGSDSASWGGTLIEDDLDGFAGCTGTYTLQAGVNGPMTITLDTPLPQTPFSLTLPSYIYNVELSYTGVQSSSCPPEAWDPGGFFYSPPNISIIATPTGNGSYSLSLDPTEVFPQGGFALASIETGIPTPLNSQITSATVSGTLTSSN